MRHLRLLICLFALAAAACGTDVRRHGTIDQSAKVMVVPAGGEGLLGGVKDGLRQDGWTLVVGRGSVRSDPAPGALLRPDIPPRYSLSIEATRIDSCITSQLYAYSIAVIDNESGTEVLTLSGNECGLTIVRKLREALRG